jgi:hypothetical protein
MIRHRIAFGAAALSAALAAGAQEPIAYPDAGQDVARQTQDDRECRAWAKQDTGMEPAAGSAPSPRESADDSAARVLGAAGGASAGVPGGVERTFSERAAQLGAAAAAENRQSAGAEPQSSAEYRRAYARCMEARGYTLK